MKKSSLLISFWRCSILYLRDYVSTMQLSYQVYNLFLSLRVLSCEEYNSNDKRDTCYNVSNQQAPSRKGQVQDCFVRVYCFSLILLHCLPPAYVLPVRRPCFS